MRYIALGCVVGILSLMSLVSAQTPPLPPDATQILLEPTAEVSLEPGLILTPTNTPISTLEPSIATDSAASPAEITATLTVSAMSTQDLIILPTSDTAVVLLPSQTFTPTITPTLSLRSINGQAFYPNRVLGQAFIRVQAFAPDNTLLSTTYTDANGLYALVVLSDQVTRVEIDAPLHLSETLYLVPGIAPAPILLRAGDLDGDACVGRADIGIMTLHYMQSFAGADLDSSGIVDVIDLTLLSTNYDVDCVPPPITTATETPIVLTPVATDETIPVEAVTLTLTPLPTEVSLTEEAIPTATNIATEESVPPAMPTEEAAAIEPTIEVTAES